MTTAKTTAWLAGTVAMLALGSLGYQYRAATIRGEDVERLTQERNKLREALSRSEQSSARLVQRAAQAEQRNSDLRHKLDGILAGKPMQTIRAPVGEAPALDEGKMARMKPLLEQGMPIKGVVIVLVDGQPVQRQVQFVMGKETRIDAADDGTYVVTPTLNEDGSVRYGITLLRKNSGGGPDQVETLPVVTQTPWGGFTLGGGSGKVFAFDNDNSGP